MLRLLLVVIATLVSIDALAERRALLVGVSAYPNLSADKQLRGPMNDVPLVRDALAQRGFRAENITVVADGVADGELPTRANILRAAAALVDAAKPGDFIVLYLTGHGSQMPTDDTVPPSYRKPYGRQQLFLARDVSGWDKGLKRVPNAVVDHELTQVVERLRDKGAFVWAIVDACHSASLVRGGDSVPGQQARLVSPQDLGIPTSAFGASPTLEAEANGMVLDVEQPSAGTRGAASAAGDKRAGYVAFYAAGPHEVTEEEPLPAGVPGRVPRGLFSYSLVSALLSTDGVSYRQLGSSVLTRYRSMNRQIPTPQFTGTQLDAPIFGDRAMAVVRQWPVAQDAEGLSIPAGVLHQVGEGAILGLVPTPLSKDSDLIGYARVTRAAVTQSRLVPIEYDGRSVPGPKDLEMAKTARLVQPAVDFTLRVALPQLRASGKDGAAARLVDAVRGKLPSNARVSWVTSTDSHDVRIESAASRVWLVPQGSRLVTSGSYPHVSADAESPEAMQWLRDSLVKMSRALNLLRVASAVDTSGNRRNLDVTAELERNGKRSPLNQASMAELRDGDHVFVTVQNLNANVAVDFTALYVDDRFEIQSLAADRIPAASNSSGGARLPFDFWINSTTTGREQLVLIGVEAASGVEPFDFSGLQQGRLESTRGSSNEVVTLLEDAGFGPGAGGGTRGGGPARLPSRLQMEVRSFMVLPGTGQAAAR